MTPHRRFAEGAARRLARVAPEFSSKQLRAPVFVVGFNNSGKSTITHLLSSLPDVALYPGEGNAELWFPGMFPWRQSALDIGPIWSDPDRFVAEAMRRHAGSFLRARAALGALRFTTRSTFVLNDSGMLAALAPEVARHLPAARFVHFIRDGREAAYVTARLEWSAMLRAPGRYQQQRIPLDFASVLERMASYWAWTIDRMDSVAAAHPERVMEVRFEDCLRDTDAQVRRIAQFIGIDAARLSWRPAPREDLGPMIRAEQTEAERELLERILRPALAAKGY